jgi:hypothetical protein
MANGFTLNGTTASLAPYSIRWRDIEVGTDGDGRTIISANQEIDMDFEGASISMCRQWLERASSGSLNMDVLDENRLAYRTLSSVFIKVTSYPATENINAGPFSVVVTRVPKV